MRLPWGHWTIDKRKSSNLIQHISHPPVSVPLCQAQKLWTRIPLLMLFPSARVCILSLREVTQCPLSDLQGIVDSIVTTSYSLWAEWEFIVHNRRKITWAQFKVENTLFKVPRIYFEKGSSIFSDMFAVANADRSEGSTDENPIKLESIEKVDFQRLLNAMFPE